MNWLNIISAVAGLGMFAFVIGLNFYGDFSTKNLSTSEIPSYISTKDDTSHIRSGAGKDYPIIFTYYNKSFPLKVLKTHDEWYYVQDHLGNRGWIFINITSKKQTVITITDSGNIYKNYNIQGKVLAIVKQNNILDLIKCDATYNLCEVGFKHKNLYLKGWISSQYIWGKNHP